MLKITLYTTLLVLLLTACGANETDNQQTTANNKEQYSLKATDSLLHIPLDNTMPIRSFCMFPYNAPDGIRYLTYLNPMRNEILFFDIDKQVLSHRVTVYQDGINNIGEAVGFKIISLDSILITTTFQTKLYLINRKGEILDKYEYGTLINGTVEESFFARTGDGVEIDFYGGKMYLPAYPWGQTGYDVEQAVREKHRLCIEYDTATKQGTYLDFQFPADYWLTGFKPMYFSRILANGQFIYSLCYHHDLFITKPDHKEIIRKTAKSKYIDDFVEWKNQDFLKYLASSPSYRNIIYDPYRNLYYRLVRHTVELSTEDNAITALRYPAKFSVMILDKDFNVLGETMLPEKTYYMFGFFVAKEGIYFQESHPENPNFTEDELVFRLFKPVANEL